MAKENDPKETNVVHGTAGIDFHNVTICGNFLL